MMALAGRPLTGEWLKLGVGVREVTDRVRSAVALLEEEHRPLQAEEATAYRQLFGPAMAVPEPEEEASEEYDNVIHAAFRRAGGDGEHRDAG